MKTIRGNYGVCKGENRISFHNRDKEISKDRVNYITRPYTRIVDVRNDDGVLLSVQIIEERSSCVCAENTDIEVIVTLDTPNGLFEGKCTILDDYQKSYDIARYRAKLKEDMFILDKLCDSNFSK